MMKTINHLPKRVLSFVLALVMVLSLVPMAAFAAEETGTTLYLKPNANWLQGDARFAVYSWDIGDYWADLTDDDADGYYEVTLPAGITNIIFCRMNPAATENNWNNKWNQTADLTVPTDGTNCYTVAEGAWDKGSGTWSAYAPEVEEPAFSADYYLVGYINGADYNGDDYKFENGKLTVTFDADSYVAIKSSAVGDWYMFAAYCTDTTGTLNTGNSEKMFVPGGVEVTFTLAENEDGSLTLSYTTPVVEPDPDAPETTDTYVVAGTANLCGSEWDASAAANTMTDNGDGTFTKVFTDVPVGKDYQFKVVKNGSTWIGDNDHNITFNVTEVCDVTVTINTADNKITVTGSGVAFETGLEITTMHAVGNGSGNWLNGKSWDTSANVMTETAPNVYEITFENVPAGSAYEFKFAANKAWTHSWGKGATEGEAAYNGQNIKLTLTAASDVTLKLDLTKYDHTTRTGATYAVTVTEATVEPEPDPEPTTDYYLVGYINGADVSGEDYKFENGKLTATFDADSYVAIKSSATDAWYMTNGWLGTEITSAVLATDYATTDKLFVPGGMELDFTLVENEDGTLTLSYAEAKDTTAVTIHFLKPDTWSTAMFGYTWGGADLGGWPGISIPENAEHAGWYDLVVEQEDPSSFNFIFNDNSNQTADLTTGEVTGDTELWVMDGKVLTEAPQEWFGIYTYNISIHFKNEAAWETVNVKFGQGDSWEPISGYEDYTNNEFGVAMEEDSFNEGWYSLTVTVTGNDSAINGLFNKGAWGEGNQTGNWTTGTLTGDQDFWYTNGAMTTTAPEGWFNANMKVYVPGTFPGPSWDAASNLMTFDAELGLYTYTFEDVPAANYEFKIAINGSWAENYGAGGVKDGANIAVTVPQTMDVIVYYNSTTHNAVTNVNYVFADVTLTGTGIPDGTKLTDKGLTGIYSAKVPMTIGTYTDVKILVDGEKEYKFDEIVLEENKDVTFYIDPVTGIFYCDASNTPIDTASIVFDSQDETYKTPFGAVAQNEEVTFSIATGADVSSAVLVIKGVASVPMTKGEDGLWTATTSIANMGEYDYYFALSNGSTIAIYGDDDGYYGTGKVSELTDVMPYDLVVYEAGYETPDWMKNAVIYQIFPDRFFDGDSTNNQAQTWARGDVDYEFITDWYTLPENPEQEAMLDKDTYLSSGAHYGDGEWSNEIYGGDLEGITERIDYLKALGVNVIYLNPVFWSISNHRYDAVSYTEIDPILGTLGDFEELVAIAEANDMHIILDGVFNHVSDDSVYFDRYYKFLPDAAEKYDGKIGAYPYWAYVYDYMAETGADQATAEGVAKTHFTEEYGITDYSYTEWFAVSSTKTGDVYSYEGWWGYDSMPVIKSTNGSEYQTGNWAEEIIDGQNSVNAYWISKGMDGWRLDVANEVSDETWQKFRDSVKALDSEAVIIGEIWDDATKYLMGDMYDSVMNYQFRNAVTKYAMGTNSVETTKSMEKIRERYPEEAFYAMMNLVGSHDTSRLLSYLDGIGDDRNQKDFDSAFPTYEKTSQLAKNRQYLVAFLQFTYAGAPTIYYGDEIGMVGSDDPDDRRAFEWGKGNQELVEWYAKLAAIREAYPALRTGTVEPMDLGDNNLLAFVREDADAKVIVISNNAQAVRNVELEGEYVDLVTGEAFTGAVPALKGVILVEKDDAKTITVNTADLAPAYDPAYIVGERCLEHTWVDADCDTPKTCSVCGETEGEALGHTWVDADCDTPKTCSVCGETEGEALGHTWVDAACDTPKTCSVCGETEGEALGHTWVDADCDTPKTCSVCGETEGEALGHDFVNGKCTRCEEADPDYKEPADPELLRIYGATRYQTAFKVADQLKANLGVEKFQNVIVASGTDFADALAGSYLAKQKNAPILLVRNRAQEMTEVKEYIKNNLAAGGTVYLLGGEKAVPKAMETGLEGFQVKRLGGATRYDTNLEILNEAGITNEEILVCTGVDYADSLSASATGLPIMLVKNSLNQRQIDFLKDPYGNDFTIIGGTKAVNVKVENQLKEFGEVARLAGNTRYQTSVMVAKRFFDVNFGLENPENAVLAYSEDYPDGLCGGVLANSMKAPLLLVKNGKQAEAVKYTAEYGIAGGVVLGGTKLVSDAVAKEVLQVK